MKILLIVLGVIVVIVLLLRKLASNHMKWLAQQTPTGVWRAQSDGKNITLQFDGGPKEGLYQQLIVSEGTRMREGGHWCSDLGELRMLIMATDVPSHARFGEDTVYKISYVGPNSIKIEGPDRAGIVYERVTDGTRLDSGEIVEPSAGGNAATPRASA